MRASGHVLIYAGLDAIARLAPESHAILIDDLRDFNGANSYPAATDLVERLRGLN
ncbi:MAG: hypothetical protein ACREDA_12865 [Methylocella sp.]